MTSQKWRTLLGEHLVKALPEYRVVVGAKGCDFISIGDGTEKAGSATIYIESRGTIAYWIKWQKPRIGEMSRGIRIPVESIPPNSGAGWITMFVHEVKRWIQQAGVKSIEAVGEGAR